MVAFCATLCATVFFPSIASAVTPQITVSASAVTLLGGNQTISITLTLIDSGNSGMMKIAGTNIIPPQSVSSTTPGSTATVGPIWGSDVIVDAFGNANRTYYRVQVFTVSNGVIGSTPVLQNFYQFAGSGTVDLSTATPLAPSFFTGPSGSVSMPGNLSVAGTLNVTGATTLGSVTGTTFNVQSNTFVENTPTAGQYFRDNGTSFAPSAIQAGDLPATTSPCSGVQLAIGLNSGGTSNCVTPPTFKASGASHAVGYVPDPGSSAGTTRFLREDATWAAPGGGGNLSTVYNTTASATAASIGSTSMVTAPASDTNYRFSFALAQTQATAGCTVAPNITVIVSYTEAFRNTTVNLNAAIAPDSGVFSTTGNANFASSLTHYVYFGHADFRAKASTAISYSTNYFAGSGCGTGANYSIAPVLVQE